MCENPSGPISSSLALIYGRCGGGVVAYIEMFYNCKRLHSFIDYSNPNDFERMIEIPKAA
jgi:hypothetical protein